MLEEVRGEASSSSMDGRWQESRAARVQVRQVWLAADAGIQGQAGVGGYVSRPEALLSEVPFFFPKRRGAAESETRRQQQQQQPNQGRAARATAQTTKNSVIPARCSPRTRRVMSKSRANGAGDETSRAANGSSFARSASASQSGAKSTRPTDERRYGSQSIDDRRYDERRHEERRVTERTYETHVERVHSSSPDKALRRDKRRRKSAEWRPRERQPQQQQHQQQSVSLSPLAAEPWKAEVRLLPPTSAPLASRVSMPPLASTMPQALQPRPLGDMSLELQEAAMVEDLLFVFMGYEGQYVRYAKGYNPTDERDRLSGPTFRILPGLDPSLHDLTQSMLRMATHYSALVAFGHVQSREDFGVVNHALCAAVRRFLQDYLVLMAQLETQFLTSDSFTMHVLNLHTVSMGHMMLQLYSLAQELLKKNGLLDEESDGDGDDESDSDDYDKVMERLTPGGDLMAGNMGGKGICKGGAVLAILTRRLETLSGDPAARALLQTLLREASRPYMVMLNEWLHHGAINDPHSEFLIKEQKSIRRERLEQDYTDEYWERRYTIRDQNGPPPQLDGVKDKVLLAGKYLNVVRECGGVDASKQVADVPTSLDDDGFLDNVNNAYAHANASLMQLLLTAHALPARLRSMKHYFFLDPSDYFSYFLELGASELRKPVKSVNTVKLQSLLDLVLRQPGSVVALDPFKEDVKVEMKEMTLIKSLQRVVNITGIEQGGGGEGLQQQQSSSSSMDQQPLDKNATGFTSLQLDYSVPFPVSLVISRKTVWRYQALFRYLVSLRYLESQLSTTWQTQTRALSWAHRGRNGALEMWKRRAWTLRARMLVFVQQLLYYCTAEVMEPNWNRFIARLYRPGLAASSDAEAEQRQTTRTRTVDELMQDHVDFLDTCLKECMLTNSKLLRIHSKLMQTCTVFAAYTNWLTRELDKADPDLCGSVKPRTMNKDQWRRFRATRSSVSATSATPSSSSSASAPAASAVKADADADADAHADARVRDLSDIIRKWEANFSRHLQILLDALNHYAATETVVLLSLCARLSAANHGTDYAGIRADDDVAASA
ncbi:hypothetical protein XA68_12125 [Ophiocordyceps unilateralis]|uniref:Spindle pole body component n=1 Tax=Ophiocordyceps unilateralis TaxID=268505 RepID=A0A2A9PEZ6_OPHUN|nr:hypothetical protein XA68_12125 [Ophiocordyceps unilateralis]